MSRRTWVLVTVLSLLLCIGFLTLYFHANDSVSSPPISGKALAPRGSPDALTPPITYRHVR
jgi:hypothetical protein